MENAIVNSKRYSSFENTHNGTSGFTENVLKERISFFEKELNSKDAIIEL